MGNISAALISLGRGHLEESAAIGSPWRWTHVIGALPANIPGNGTYWAGVTPMMFNRVTFAGSCCFSHVAQKAVRRPTFAIGLIIALGATVFVLLTLRERSQVSWMIPLLGFCQLSLLGGYAVYFPELFPARRRSSGISFCANIGRFLAASGPAVIRTLMLPFAPKGNGRPLPEDADGASAGHQPPMRRSLRPSLAVLLAGALAAPLPAASLLLTGGTIHTADDAQPRAEAVLATDGRIAFVGSAAEARRRAPPGTRTIELAGRAVFPGFVDAHAHLSGIGQRELTFNLEGVRSLAELQSRLRARAAEPAEPGAWIVGRGWIESQWTPPAFPTRHDLDAAVAERPVVLRRADGHALVANSRALALARIDRSTPNPAGGEILRDAAGEATGLLIDNAMSLVTRLVPASGGAAETVRALEIGAAREVRLGWTTVHIAGAGLGEVATIRRLQREGRLKLRTEIYVGGPGSAAEALLNAPGEVAARGIKCFIDGALGSRGAALLEPYADKPDSRGLLVTSEAALLPLFIRALRAGVQIETHAIGDRGNRLVLDLYEKAFAAVPRAERKIAEPRWRIEHAQVIHPADIPRFAALGVIASMQPSHAIGDLYFAPARLGPERLRGAYAWRTLLDSGAIIAGGSDAPVERGEPLIEFYAAVARRALDGFADANWHRELRVTRAEALKMFTLWPAFAVHAERERGSITVGKAADFTVFSADLMVIPEPEILQARCVLTVIDGEIAWEER